MHQYFKDRPLRTELSALAAVLMLAAIGACAQTPVVAPPASEPPVSTPEAAPAAAQGPAYTASNIALAFAYIDTNKDGKISREEAAGFRGVAKYFDEADINKDSLLSREEFENAMNRSKPK
jgi:EF hand